MGSWVLINAGWYNLNVYAERWVKSVKDECVSKLIFFVKLRCGTPFAII